MDHVGFGVRMEVGPNDQTKTQIYGQGIDNLKEEIKNEILAKINEEIAKSKDETTKEIFTQLHEAVKTNDKGLIRKIVDKLTSYEEGYIASKIIEIVLMSLIH